MWAARAQDTGDTRETPAIDVCKGLLKDNARLHIYDPKVSEQQIRDDLATSKFEWDHPQLSPKRSKDSLSHIRVFDDAIEACKVSSRSPGLTHDEEPCLHNL